MSKIILGLVVVLFLTASAGFVKAESLEIVGNANGSTNGINVKGTNSNTNSQTNNTNYQNNIDANANSGGNSATGNTGGNAVIKTGDTSVKVNVNNQGGSNVANIDNCCDKKPTTTPTKKPTTTPTTTPTPNNGGGNGNNDNGGGNGGVGGGGSTSNNPQIIGLSKTSGENNLPYLFYSAGLVCLGLGGRFLLKR